MIRQSAMALTLGVLLIVSVVFGAVHVPTLSLALFGLGMFCLLWSLLYTVLTEQDAAKERPARGSPSPAEPKAARR
jgi:hypothetical protein